jgi:hypothetical protein
MHWVLKNMRRRLSCFIIFVASGVAAMADPLVPLSPEESSAVTSSYESSLAALAQLRAHDAIMMSRASADIKALKEELAAEQSKSAGLAKALADATKK